MVGGLSQDVGKYVFGYDYIINDVPKQYDTLDTILSWEKRTRHNRKKVLIAFSDRNIFAVAMIQFHTLKYDFIKVLA